MASFEDYIFQSFSSLIVSWDAALVSDIYALGFLINFEDQDLRYGTVGLVYNTNQNYQSALAAAAIRYPEAAIGSPEADMEVKWHFDYWHQFELWVHDELPLVAKGSSPHADPVGIALRQTWLESEDLWYTDMEEEADFERTLNIGGFAARSFNDVCIRVARRLHAEGLTRIGNKGPLPIVFHNYYYDDVAAECTHKANPPGLAQDFERYVLVNRPSAKN